jgi:integrase
VAAVKLAREESRTRRLQPGEEERLLLASGGLHDLIVAALETGCRLGELLSLQWEQVRAELFLPAGKTKEKKPRRVPISTVLQTVLAARRNDPAGDPLPPDGFVFGDAVGRPRHSIKTAWKLTCARAKITDLHFHDLRREAGSRWMDAGVPLATIQRWLGHHNISQTSTYLAASGGGDADAMRAFETATGRLPSVAVSAGSNRSEPISSDITATEKTQSNVTVH